MKEVGLEGVVHMIATLIILNVMTVGIEFMINIKGDTMKNFEKFLIEKPTITEMPDMKAKLPDHAGQLIALTEYQLNEKWEAFHKQVNAGLVEALEEIKDITSCDNPCGEFSLKQVNVWTLAQQALKAANG